MPIDYSKWNNIDLSDDEEKMHPNVDNNYMIRLNREARARDKQETEREKSELEKKINENKKRKEELNNRESNESDQASLEKIRVEREELTKQEEEFRKKEEEIKKKERLAPLDTENLCHEKFSKSSINKKQDTTEELIPKMKYFASLTRLEDSRAYLLQNPQLVCEETATVLSHWCIDFEKEAKHDKMDHLAHQCMCVQFILQISKSFKQDIPACVEAFFHSIISNDRDTKEAFEEELNEFKRRVKEKLSENFAQDDAQKLQHHGEKSLDLSQMLKSLPDNHQK